MASSPVPSWLKTIRPIFVGIALVVILTLTLISNLLTAPTLSLKVGDTAPEDILAPRSISFFSEVLTKNTRQEAIDGVRDVYNPPDVRVARNQVSHTRLILDFIETVRADTLAGRERQISYIQAVPELEIDNNVLDILFNLSTTGWETVRQDTLDVVDEAMREEIRPDRLEEARAAIPLLVRLELSEDEATVVTALAQDLIVPNSTFNALLTQQAREEAANLAEPVRQSFDLNSTIVHQGDVLDEADIEAMQQFGMMQSEQNWQDTISPFIISLLVVILLALYIQKYFPRFLSSGRHLSLISFLLVLFVLAAKLIVPGRAIMPFFFPAAGLAMLLTVLFDANLAIVVSIYLAVLVGYIGGNSLELAMYTGVGGITSALVLKKSPRISSFFRAGIIVAIANICVILIYRLDSSDLLGILQLIGASALNGLFSAAITLVGFYVIGNVFNVVTSFQLLELARLDHPLLQELLRLAPGTYHHSLMVANLAEQAARKIGADADLVRVGSFYHDVGKIIRPYFFTENQNGDNAHQRLDPLTSAQTIANHVKDGIDLAKRYRLPEKIRAFIPEHHGTRTVRYFYHQAKKAATDPDLIQEKDFKYPGPKPASRETAIVLLADSCEAASTALQSRTEQELARVVNEVINSIALDGELNNSGLTMGDIQAIKESFIESLQGRFHARPKYPGQRTSDQLKSVKNIEKVITKPKNLLTEEEE
ncbi:MAG: HDIG domain-containing protein [Anaerolineales bacterium]|nr:HDIG domain-containing protein [Anaerolineales bacterium]